jgi:ubiquitin
MTAMSNNWAAKDQKLHVKACAVEDAHKDEIQQAKTEIA